MTREDKRIREIGFAAADSISFDLFESPFSAEEQEFLEYCFVTGAQWADKHPDVSSLWHDAKEMPNYGSAYIAIDNNNHIWICEKSLIVSQTLWDDIVSVRKIYKWIYIADILPKVGE